MDYLHVQADNPWYNYYVAHLNRCRYTNIQYACWDLKQGPGQIVGITKSNVGTHVHLKENIRSVSGCHASNGIAPITQLQICVIKITDFLLQKNNKNCNIQGMSPNVVKMIFHTIKERIRSLSGSEFLPH